jgi:hypothetical protein
MSTRAARDSAVPLVRGEELASWASEQARLIKPEKYGSRKLLRAASAIRACGGHTASLPIAATGSLTNWLNFEQLVEWSRPLEAIRVLSVITRTISAPEQEPTLEPDVLFVPEDRRSSWPWDYMANQDLALDDDLPRSLEGAALEAVAAAWSLSREDLFAQLRAARSTLEEDIVGTDGKGTRITGLTETLLRKPRAHR